LGDAHLTEWASKMKRGGFMNFKVIEKSIDGDTVKYLQIKNDELEISVALNKLMCFLLENNQSYVTNKYKKDS
jgi:hypothetical protein